MSRTSRVPYHQNVYDLLRIGERQDLEAPAAEIAAWESRTGRTFPAAMKEFYTTSVTLRVGKGERESWTMTLPELWSEYSNAEQARSVPEVFQPFTPRRYLSIPATPISGFELIWENQGIWVMCARDDGSADPLVDVSGPCFLSPPEVLNGDQETGGWHVLGTFSELLMSWFAVYYLEDFAPMSYGHHAYQTGLAPEHAPAKPYLNGLWLRSPDEPLAVPITDFLTEQLGEPDRTSRPGDVTTYTWRLEGGTIRVTADHPAHPEPLSAWWVHADTPERLAEFARLLLPWGTLRDTLRADTDPARDVWNCVRG